MDSKSDKIRICHIITRLDKGGAPDVVRLICEKLDPARFDITLVYGVTCDPAKKTKDWVESLGFRAILVKDLFRDLSPLHDIAAFIRLLHILWRGRFDIVHTHTAKAGILGRLAARLCRVPGIVHSPHGHDFYGYFNPTASCLIVWAERFASLFCDKIHVLTRLEERDMLAYRICPSEKMKVIYSGIAINPLSEMLSGASSCDPADPEPSFARVGFVGRLEPVKGPDIFIDAARFVASRIPDVRFLLIGDGSLRARLEEKARAWGLESRVFFMGWQEDVSGYLDELDILVMPSRNEGVGRSALEEQAAGVPVVASRVGGIPEVVRDNETGILFSPGDPAACAEAIIGLLSDSTKRRRLGAAGRSWVRKMFSQDVMADNFASLYRDVLAPRSVCR